MSRKASGRLNKYEAITRKPATRIAGSTWLHWKRGHTHTHSVSQTHSRTILKALSLTDALCICTLCVCGVALSSLPFSMKSWSFTRFAKKDASGPCELGCPRFSQQERTPQHSSAETPQRPWPLEETPSFQIREKGQQERSAASLTLPERAPRPSPVRAASSQADSCALARAGQIPSEPPD